jgi:hypothetical protein
MGKTQAIVIEEDTPGSAALGWKERSFGQKLLPILRTSSCPNPITAEAARRVDDEVNKRLLFWLWQAVMNARIAARGTRFRHCFPGRKFYCDRQRKGRIQSAERVEPTF